MSQTTNIEGLRAILESVNALPDAGSGGSGGGVEFIQCEAVASQTIQIPEDVNHVIIRHVYNPTGDSGACIIVYLTNVIDSVRHFSLSSPFLSTYYDLSILNGDSFTIEVITIEPGSPSDLTDVVYAFVK